MCFCRIIEQNVQNDDRISNSEFPDSTPGTQQELLENGPQMAFLHFKTQDILWKTAYNKNSSTLLFCVMNILDAQSKLTHHSRANHCAFGG